MTLLIRKPGLLTTIQDLGRTGSRSFGINPGGVMDRAAARIANAIIGNPDSAPVLEMHFPASELQFENETVFAIAGADFAAQLDGTHCRNWTVSLGKSGGILKFSKKRSGQRVYLAVPDGFETDTWLGSSSTNLTARIGGHSGRALKPGDRLKSAGAAVFQPFTAGNSLMSGYSSSPTVRILEGPEFEFLTASSERAFVNDTFTLSTDCDRMGYRLTGRPLHLLHEREMVSSSVTFGTIQLLPDGQLIVLMADHQTSGGYPRIGTVISVDLPVLAQCGPGDRVEFEAVSIAEAEQLAIQFERELNFLRVGCRLQTQNAKR